MPLINTSSATPLPYRTLVVCLALLAAASGTWAGEGDTTAPNIVIILADDLGYGDLSSYGATDLETPHIDGLMAESMKLVNFYANCPVCSPTRAALLSGRYQESVGVPGVIRTHSKNSWGYLSPDAVLLPKALADGGYVSALVGKWHLGLAPPNTPLDRGFNHFYGFLGDMMDDYYHHRRHDVNYMRRQRREIDPEGHATDLFTDAACRWIMQQKGDQPFFLYLPYNAPHSPIQPPTDYLARYQAKHPDASPQRAGLAALVEHMDAGIGQVLDALDRSGAARSTLVLFTSDNGGSLRFGSLNGPLRDGKGTTYEGGIRVPMCARWPGKIEAGSESDVVALTMDLYPTALEAAGLPPRDDLDGVSILPILLQEEKTLPSRDLVFSRLMPPGRIYALRRGNYKILTPEASHTIDHFEVYDLATDPQETTDLSESRPRLAAELESALRAHIARFADVPYRAPDGLGPGEIQ